MNTKTEAEMMDRGDIIKEWKALDRTDHETFFKKGLLLRDHLRPLLKEKHDYVKFLDKELGITHETARRHIAFADAADEAGGVHKLWKIAPSAVYRLALHPNKAALEQGLKWAKDKDVERVGTVEAEAIIEELKTKTTYPGKGNALKAVETLAPIFNLGALEGGKDENKGYENVLIKDGYIFAANRHCVGRMPFLHDGGSGSVSGRKLLQNLRQAVDPDLTMGNDKLIISRTNGANLEQPTLATFLVVTQVEGTEHDIEDYKTYDGHNESLWRAIKNAFELAKVRTLSPGHLLVKNDEVCWVGDEVPGRFPAGILPWSHDNPIQIDYETVKFIQSEGLKYIGPSKIHLGETMNWLEFGQLGLFLGIRGPVVHTDALDIIYEEAARIAELYDDASELIRGAFHLHIFYRHGLVVSDATEAEKGDDFDNVVKLGYSLHKRLAELDPNDYGPEEEVEPMDA